jgi:translation elongation factor EF-G
MALWTIDHELDQPIRHVNQAASGGSYVAIFTLRLAPDLNDAAVRFASAIDDPEAGPWIPCIEEGVRAFVGRRAQEGFPIAHLRVTLVAITIHPVDSNPWRFRQAAEMAMSQAFEAAGIDLEA